MNKLSFSFATIVGAVFVAFLLAACQEQFQDLDTRFYMDPSEIRQEYNVLVTNPDSLTIYRNADGFPNVAIICIRGVPFSATSVTHQGGLRQILDIDGRQNVADLCDVEVPNTSTHDVVENPGGEG